MVVIVRIGAAQGMIHFAFIAAKRAALGVRFVGVRFFVDRQNMGTVVRRTAERAGDTVASFGKIFVRAVDVRKTELFRLGDETRKSAVYRLVKSVKRIVLKIDVGRKREKKIATALFQLETGKVRDRAVRFHKNKRNVIVFARRHERRVDKNARLCFRMPEGIGI